MNKKNIFTSKLFFKIMTGLLAFILLLAVFKLGMIVGGKKADFFCKWSDNYYHNFGGPREGFLKGMGDRDFIDANGIFGQVIQNDGQTLVIQDRDDREKIILFNDATVIKRFREDVLISDIKVDEHIVAIGSPNESGQFEAKLIRILPPEPQGMFNRPFFGPRR